MGKNGKKICTIIQTVSANCLISCSQDPTPNFETMNPEQTRVENFTCFNSMFSFLPHFRYQMERKIFEELLELKRNQIRAGRANEQLLVKRLSDSYAKTINELAGLKNYDGPFTFKEFEKYLYSKFESLRNYVHIL